MKTPEEMAEEYCREWWGNYLVADYLKSAVKAGFLAGYQAAKDQLADADKVITYDYVETASDEARELIAKFELKGDEEVLVKALVAAYCRGVDAVDGYLRNSLSAYRASVKQQHWISVHERLPPDGAKVLLIVFGDIHYGWIDQSPSDPTEYCLYLSNTYIDKGHHALTHWMPIPSKPKYMSDYVEYEPPKEEK